MHIYTYAALVHSELGLTQQLSVQMVKELADFIHERADWDGTAALRYPCIDVGVTDEYVREI